MKFSYLKISICSCLLLASFITNASGGGGAYITGMIALENQRQGLLESEITYDRYKLIKQALIKYKNVQEVVQPIRRAFEDRKITNREFEEIDFLFKKYKEKSNP